MQLFLSGHAYRYECENLCRLFFPYSPCQGGGGRRPSGAGSRKGLGPLPA